MHRIYLGPAIALLLVLASCDDGGTVTPTDTIAPTASITLSPRAVQAGGVVTATITFSEPVVGFTVGDLTIGGGTADVFTAMDPQTYTVTITAAGAGSTTVDVTIGNAAGHDSAGNESLTVTAQAAIAYAPWASASGSDAYGVWAELTVAGNGETAVQRFRLISPGTFQMGSPIDEPGRWTNTESLHQVTLSTPYWIADSECTQRLWFALTGTNPAHAQPPDALTVNLDRPMEAISWAAASGFLITLNLAKPNLLARLPTEAEWEYAARAGTTTPFSICPVSAQTIRCTIWAGDPYINTGSRPDDDTTVKCLPANAWGLFEVHGNVAEWCADWWQEDLGSNPVVDPTGPASGDGRVYRGSSGLGLESRSAWRYRLAQDSYGYGLGFRIAAPAQPCGPG